MCCSFSSGWRQPRPSHTLIASQNLAAGSSIRRPSAAASRPRSTGAPDQAPPPPRRGEGLVYLWSCLRRIHAFQQQRPLQLPHSVVTAMASAGSATLATSAESGASMGRGSLHGNPIPCTAKESGRPARGVPSRPGTSRSPQSPAPTWRQDLPEAATGVWASGMLGDPVVTESVDHGLESTMPIRPRHSGSRPRPWRRSGDLQRLL